MALIDEGKMAAAFTLTVYLCPKDNTPGCTKESCDFRDNLPKFKKSPQEGPQNRAAEKWTAAGTYGAVTRAAV